MVVVVVLVVIVNYYDPARMIRFMYRLGPLSQGGLFKQTCHADFDSQKHGELFKPPPMEAILDILNIFDWLYVFPVWWATRG